MKPPVKGRTVAASDGCGPDETCDGLARHGHGDDELMLTKVSANG